ncbi:MULTISPECIES: glycosyltransferase family 2 protein [Sulfitobacter]|uniref:N-acetylglucosaminyl-diphospho-decaprenol L-rhamnosyltransferase n=1 Tax=Sulfitobacter dubius TaxID=218673 RepID=A0ABY3ZJA8_9RHOB|nr:glycosyltransferase family 2 protein [Sulfitobacter dubius]UOA14205.1 N-acetylglucosaminyl-diphospho-decaprenol L-rhamnosyltransferase [Sulfitobacter dubius]WOI30301.1 glycosyltransferase family 2 protein [Sulfitobacter dubius]
MMQQMPRLLVVILNYRTAEMTLRAAEAALADMPTTNAELVIVDNDSGDGSAALLAQAITERGWGVGDRVRLISAPDNGGFGAGNNVAIRAGMSDGAPPDFVHVVNSDAFLDPGCIAGLLVHLQEHPRAGLAGSHVRGEDDLPHTTAFRFPTAAGELEGAARFGPLTRLLSSSVVAPPLPERPAQVDWVAGASVMMRWDMLTEIGLFDEEYFLYYEETDLCLRAARAGWDCWYVPQARCVHVGSVSTGMKEWRRMPRYWFDSRRRYFTKNHGRAYAALAVLARLLGGGLHHLRCLLTGRRPEDAPGFYRDLAAHALTARRSAATTKKPPSCPATEDRS